MHNNYDLGQIKYPKIIKKLGQKNYNGGPGKNRTCV